MLRHAPARALVCLTLALVVWLSAEPAFAQTQRQSADDAAEPERVWRWRRHAWYDYVYTGTLVGLAALEIALPVGSELGEKPRQGGVLLDDPVRDTVVYGSNDLRHEVGSVSDITLTLLVAYPTAIDGPVAAWGPGGSYDVTLQMLLINLQSLAYASLVTGVTKRIVDRQRPLATQCESDPNYDADCDTADNHYSFPSGHTAMSFTGASLICLHHFKLHLYGDAGDTIACSAAMMTATVTGVSRMAADKHYFSDVLGGAAVGAISGALMPYLLYYAWDTPPDVDSAMVTPVVTTDRIGASWTGVF